MSRRTQQKAAVPESEKISPNDLLDEPVENVRQGAQYNDHCQSAPLNDIFFETKSNPLSSKGN